MTTIEKLVMLANIYKNTNLDIKDAILKAMAKILKKYYSRELGL